MQRNENTKKDRTATVVPPIRPNAPWRVVAAQALPGLRLRVSFVDGTEGEVEMEDFLAGPKLNGTAFEPLREPEVFQQVAVVLGAVQWPTGADLAPDAMYDAIREHGRWVVEL